MNLGYDFISVVEQLYNALEILKNSTEIQWCYMSYFNGGVSEKNFKKHLVPSKLVISRQVCIHIVLPLCCSINPNAVVL